MSSAAPGLVLPQVDPSLNGLLPPQRGQVVDPFAFKRQLFPDVHFYRQQREVIYSVCNNKETFVPAGNKLGKDYVAGFIILYFFLTRQPCRIVTTSAKDDHLRVLWGEIKNFISLCRYQLDDSRVGPLVVNHREIKKLIQDPFSPDKMIECPKSYVKGLVASADTIATMQGHHIAELGDGIPRTLVVGDECSSLDNDYKPMFDSWANRHLYIGNTWPCDNFWKHGIVGKPDGSDKGGDLPRPNGAGRYRKVIRIRAQDSPNVRLGMAEISGGKQLSGRFVVPGVKGIAEYLENRDRWDEVQQSVSLDAEFPETAGVLLYPPAWIGAALAKARELGDRVGGKVKGLTMGIDCGEGVANTSWAIADEVGLVDVVSRKTRDTSVIPNETIALGARYGVSPINWIFDLGGGGKQWMDLLRSQGYPCRGVAFGETLVLPPQRGLVMLEQKVEHREERYEYVNRRAEMYGILRKLLDPNNPFGRPGNMVPWAIPQRFTEVTRQMAPIPLLYDPEGRMRMLPKNKRALESNEPCLVELLGASPDELDAVVMAVWGLYNKPRQQSAGVF